MAMYNEDPDVVRWSLDLLNGYFPTICDTAHTPTVVTEYHCTPYYAIADLSDCSASDVHLSTAPGFSQDWNCGNTDNCSSYRDVDIMGPSTSGYCSSSPEEAASFHGAEPWDLQITDDSFVSFDGEVGKRFDQMVPIAHVPRINGQIPSVDEATSDHQRLLDRLRLYDLVDLKVKGDGNCQFRALSDQIYRSSDHHKFVREQIIKQLKAHPEMYEGYVPMSYSEYLSKLSRDGEWGDHVTLQAAADLYGVKIFVMTSFRDTCYIEILPRVEKSKRVICLSFWAEVHYNSIYPEGELPSQEAPPSAEVKKNRKEKGVSSLLKWRF